MTIRRGQTWGDVGAAPAGLVRVLSDAAAAELVHRARSVGSPIPPMALLGGDLMRAVGGSGDESGPAGDVARLTVDVVRVTVGAEHRWFVAHLVARRPWWRGSWWRGEVAIAMNAQHVGPRDLAPRGHPNDGKVDVLRVSSSMSFRDRWRARSRAVRAAHVPHPDIEVRSTASTTLHFARPLKLWLDGRPWITVSAVELTVEPDALLACISVGS
jgi:hypothetical protein